MTENEIEKTPEAESNIESGAPAAPEAAPPEEKPSPASLTFSDDLVSRFGGALESDTNEAYQRWGLAMFHSIDEGQAHAELSKLGLEPRDALDHYNIGCTHAAAGRFKDACASLETSLALDPAFYEAKYNLALAKEQTGEAETARKLWTEALELAGEEEAGAIRQHITEISG